MRALSLRNAILSLALGRLIQLEAVVGSVPELVRVYKIKKVRPLRSVAAEEPGVRAHPRIG